MRTRNQKHKLTDKEELFCQELAKGVKPCQAYINAGYKAKTAPNNYWKLYSSPLIQERLKEYLERSREEIRFITKEYVAEQYRVIIDTTQSEHVRLRALQQLQKLLGFEEQKLQISTNEPLFTVIRDGNNQTNS